VVEDTFASILARAKCGQNATYPNRRLSSVKYFETNFFSILFLSIFKAAGISQQNIIHYGVILHALRTIVTCSDNILDNEKKGPVFLNAGLSSTVLDNVMLTLMAHKSLEQSIRMVTESGAVADRIENALLDSLCSVAGGESMSNMDRFNGLPMPEEIIEKVHRKIGGELLRLALIAPLQNETELQPVLKNMEDGVLLIGTALQMLDDVTDVTEDLLANKANLLASWIVYKSCDEYWTYDQLNQRAAHDAADFKTLFPNSTAGVVNTAIEKALNGFDMLARGGYPINRSVATALLKLMFSLRGLSDEWHLSNYADTNGSDTNKSIVDIHPEKKVIAV